MFKYLLSIFLFLNVNSLITDAKFLKHVEHVDGAIKVYAYKETAVGGNQLVCSVIYNASFVKIGWDVLEIKSYPVGFSDTDQSECAGYLEGYAAFEAIYINYYNTVKQWCKGQEKTCAKMYKFLDRHMNWIKKNMEKRATFDPIWHQVAVIYSHLNGLFEGYKDNQKDPKKNLSLIDILVMNLQPDLDDVIAAIQGDINAKLRGNTRSSAIIKLLPNNADLLIGHNTWTSYSQMYRMMKSYDIGVRITSTSNNFAPGRAMSFSGYPGVITSGDDFYLTSSGLVVLETTIGNSNASRWHYVKPTGQLFETMRSMIALRLGKNGHTWCKIFSKYNSGTYNNQWMIVDTNKFMKRENPKNGTLWVLEQIPGYIRYEDQTTRLIKQTYWPSYNVPFYPDVFNLSGNQELVNKYGDWFSYNNTPRALIFRRDQSSVTNLNSLLNLLRSNDYKHDQYSACNCTPPYSAENAIAARSDLNPKNGTYPFPALGHRPHGAIDAKVVSPLLVLNMTFIAVCGPTTGTNLPPFQWDKSGFDLPHMGQPNNFTMFKPILTPWESFYKE